jgi:hypothetical protein
MKTVHEAICTNPKVQQKILSDKQLELLLKFTAKYEFVLPCKIISVVEASALINSIIENPPKLREKPYNYDKLLQGFIAKYPEIYYEIMQRNL